MEKLSMCRICLVEDVLMYVVVNKNLHELYEKLTDVPFVTEDRKPMLACFICCAKLKQCWRFLRKCLDAEELFAQMLIEDHERDLLINPGHLEFLYGFSNSPIELISIVNGGLMASDAIKEELPDISERLDDIIEPKEEHQIEKLELDNVDNSYPDVEDTPAPHAESDSEDVPLMEIKIELEDEQESIGVPVAKKPKLETRNPTLRDTISAEQRKIENTRKLSYVPKMTTQNHASKGTTKFKEPFTKAQLEVNSSINNIALGTSYHTNSNEGCQQCKNSKQNPDSDDKKGFICVICQRSFSKRSDFIRHTRTHTGEKPFKCEICQRNFSDKNLLTRHIRVHTGEKPFKCEICQRSFSVKSNLARHSRVHTGEKPFKCNICQLGFSEKPSLVIHIRTHTGEKPFKCDICQSSFTQKIHLASHIRGHTGEKPFKCDVCQLSFSKKRNLVIHTSTHTGQKLFKCNICQRSFSLKSNLLSHTRVHTGDKPFKCDICQRSFNQKGSLTRHTRTHTDEKL